MALFYTVVAREWSYRKEFCKAVVLDINVDNSAVFNSHESFMKSIKDNWMSCFTEYKKLLSKPFNGATKFSMPVFMCSARLKLEYFS